MGGDFAPEEIVKGVADASLATAIECVLVGDEPRIQAVLDTRVVRSRAHPHPPRARRRRHARGAARGAAGQARRLDRGRRVARRRAGRPTRSSAPATPARACSPAPASSGAIKGVRKPALASVYPRHTEHPGPGSSSRCSSTSARRSAATPLDLVQFAVMGSAYAQRISKVARPRVALLNMGAEPFKGGDVLAEAHERLQTTARRQLHRQHRGQRHRQGARRRDRLRGACSATSCSSSSRASPTS